MGPTVFISSTFYDLKYIRDDIDEFVKSYRFDSILFENGDIGYIPGKPLDESCYHYISKSDMVILIIGGLYGSPATGEVEDKFKEYMSITRKEFQAAREAEIPIYAFIVSEVDAEYWVYKKNYLEIENGTKEIEFNATKNINVFRFIMEMRNYSNVVVNTFHRTADIKEYLARQWAGYFAHYLELLREQKKNKTIENSLVTLKSNIEQINLMVDEVGKKLLGETAVKDYKEIKEEQIVHNIKNIIVSSFDYIPLYKTYEKQCEFVKSFVKKLTDMLVDKSFYLYFSSDVEDQEVFHQNFKFEMVLITNIKPGVELELKEYIGDMQQTIIQNKLVEELLKDKDFCAIQE